MHTESRFQKKKSRVALVPFSSVAGGWPPARCDHASRKLHGIAPTSLLRPPSPGDASLLDHAVLLRLRCIILLVILLLLLLLLLLLFVFLRDGLRRTTVASYAGAAAGTLLARGDTDGRVRLHGQHGHDTGRGPH